MNAVINIAKEPFPAKITSLAKLQIKMPILNENNEIAIVCDWSLF